jgi:hypothetical protein
LIVRQAGQRTHRRKSIRIRLAWRSFQAAIRRSASSRDLSIGRAPARRFLLCCLAVSILHLAAVEAHLSMLDCRAILSTWNERNGKYFRNRPTGKLRQGRLRQAPVHPSPNDGRGPPRLDFSESYFY